jgi:quercetin dioxygenase-like cupin family protein
MAIPHAESGEVVSVRPLGEKLANEVTTTLIKTQHVEVLRLVLPRGKRIPRHEVPGEITLQCLEGRVNLDLGDRTIELDAGEWTYLDGHCLHGVRAVLNSTMLVTILLVREAKTRAVPWPSVLVEELCDLDEMRV